MMVAVTIKNNKYDPIVVNQARVETKTEDREGRNLDFTRSKECACPSRKHAKS